MSPRPPRPGRPPKDPPEEAFDSTPAVPIGAATPPPTFERQSIKPFLHRLERHSRVGRQSINAADSGGVAMLPEAWMPGQLVDTQSQEDVLTYGRASHLFGDLTQPHASDITRRLRVSPPITTFDHKGITEDDGQFDFETTGGGSVEWHANRASHVIRQPAGGASIRQSRPRITYQATKGNSGLLSFRMGPHVPGSTIRVGLFDALDGVFIERDDDGARIVVRTSTPVAIERTLDYVDWPVPPEVNLDYVQLFVIDWSWYGTGDIRVGFQVDGVPRYLYELHHANTSPNPALATPHLPIRYEVHATTEEATLETMSAAVISEGGSPIGGHYVGVDSGDHWVTVPAAGKVHPVIAARLRPGSRSGNARPVGGSLFPEVRGSTIFRWLAAVNPVIEGPPITWQSIPGSDLEFARDFTAEHSLTPGYRTLVTGYGEDDSEIALQSWDPSADWRMGFYIDGTPETVVLAVEHVEHGGGSTANNYLGTLAMRETI